MRLLGGWGPKGKKILGNLSYDETVVLLESVAMSRPDHRPEPTLPQCLSCGSQRLGLQPTGLLPLEPCLVHAGQW